MDSYYLCRYIICISICFLNGPEVLALVKCPVFFFLVYAVHFSVLWGLTVPRAMEAPCHVTARDP